MKNWTIRMAMRLVLHGRELKCGLYVQIVPIILDNVCVGAFEIRGQGVGGCSGENKCGGRGRRQASSGVLVWALTCG